MYEANRRVGTVQNRNVNRRQHQKALSAEGDRPGCGTLRTGTRRGGGRCPRSLPDRLQLSFAQEGRAAGDADGALEQVHRRAGDVAQRALDRRAQEPELDRRHAEVAGALEDELPARDRSEATGKVRASGRNIPTLQGILQLRRSQRLRPVAPAAIDFDAGALDRLRKGSKKPAAAKG